ncbi:phosphotransferase [Kribbella sp. NPDC055071]
MRSWARECCQRHRVPALHPGCEWRRRLVPPAHRPRAELRRAPVTEDPRHQPVVDSAGRRDLASARGPRRRYRLLPRRSGPWNFVWNDNTAVGLIDWDYLHPGPRLGDIAYALQWFVPLRSDEFALEWHHFHEIPDRRHRIAVFLDAYGDLPTFDVVDAVTARMAATRDLVKQLAEGGQEPQRTWVLDGSLDRDNKEIAWILEHRDLLT